MTRARLTRTRLRALLLIAGLGLGPAVPALAARVPSVLVQTAMPRRGSLPETVTAYGSAAPAVGASMRLSRPRAGRVLAIAVTPGERVQAGQRLLDFAPSAQALSAYQQAVSALALARRTRADTAELLKQRLATRGQMAQAEASVRDAEAALAAQQREGGGRASVAITAPFAGIVTAIPVVQGDRTAPGAALVTLVRAGGLVATVGIEPADRARLRPGDAARLEPLAGGTAIDGRVIRVSGMIDPKTRLVDTDISLPPGALAGEAFRAVITVGTFTGWLVPRDAVLSDAQGAYLFQLAAGRAVRVAVTRRGTVGAITVVAGPIDPRRPLVTAGNYQLSDGMAVRQGRPPS